MGVGLGLGLGLGLGVRVRVRVRVRVGYSSLLQHLRDVGRAHVALAPVRRRARVNTPLLLSGHLPTAVLGPVLPVRQLQG